MIRLMPSARLRDLDGGERSERMLNPSVAPTTRQPPASCESCSTLPTSLPNRGFSRFCFVPDRDAKAHTRSGAGGGANSGYGNTHYSNQL